MNPEGANEAVSHLQAYADNIAVVPEGPDERLRWAMQQRTLLHAAQEAVLAEIEVVWQIEQVARGQVHGEA